VNQPMLIEAKRHLKESDPVIGRLIESLGDIDLRHRPANFESFIKIIATQQLSDKAAKTIFSRIKSKCSENALSPKIIFNIGLEGLCECGLSNAKADYVIGIAMHFLENPNYINILKRTDSEAALESLMSLKGFGIWSASVFLLFNLQNVDIFPYGDATLQKAICLLYDVKINKKHGEEEKISKAWAPYRSIASLYLWEWMDQGQPL
jgi:DNA-3-methyladenine glycosylase II